LISFVIFIPRWLLSFFRVDGSPLLTVASVFGMFPHSSLRESRVALLFYSRMSDSYQYLI